MNQNDRRSQAAILKILLVNLMIKMKQRVKWNC